MPTLIPAASTSTDGRTFGHSTGRPVASSIRFAARKGYRAWAARALRAPRRSPGNCRAVGESTDPKSKSWLPMASAVYPIALYASTIEGALAEIRLDAALKGVAGVDQQDRPAVRRPGRAQIVHVSREQGQTAEPVSRQRPRRGDRWSRQSTASPAPVGQARRRARGNVQPSRTTRNASAKMPAQSAGRLRSIVVRAW